MLSDWTRQVLATASCGLLAFAASHLLMEQVSRFMEVHEDAYLWQYEEWLQILTPTNYVGQGEHRILLTGPSEAREGLDPKSFAEALPGWEPYQNSLSMGSMEDVLIQLEYMERAYGPSAMPRKLVLGVATRFLLNLVPVESPLQQAIQKYSPLFGVEGGNEGEPARLVPKDLPESLASRLRFLPHQGHRYRRSLRALRRMVIERLLPEQKGAAWLEAGLTPSKYRGKPPRDKSRYREWAETGLGDSIFYPKLRTLRASDLETRIRSDADQLAAMALRYGIDVYVVNLPEGSWTEPFYAEGVYQDYHAVLRAAIGETPFLDLRRFLDDSQFFDWAHPTHEGAIRISQRVARFIVETDRGRGG